MTVIHATTFGRDRKLYKPMLGTQRRIEARIGQLLGEVTQGERIDLTSYHGKELQINDRIRNDFRTLAKGFKEYPLDWETWQQSRKSLTNYIGSQRRIEARIGQLLEEDNNRIGGGEAKPLIMIKGLKLIIVPATTFAPWLTRDCKGGGL